MFFWYFKDPLIMKYVAYQILGIGKKNCVKDSNGRSKSQFSLKGNRCFPWLKEKTSFPWNPNEEKERNTGSSSRQNQSWCYAIRRAGGKEMGVSVWTASLLMSQFRRSPTVFLLRSCCYASFSFFLSFFSVLLC